MADAAELPAETVRRYIREALEAAAGRLVLDGLPAVGSDKLSYLSPDPAGGGIQYGYRVGFISATEFVLDFGDGFRIKVTVEAEGELP